MFYEQWMIALKTASVELLTKFALIIPNLIGAVLVLVIGSMIACAVSHLVEKIITTLKIDAALEKTVIKPINESLKIKISISKFFQELTKWFLLIIVFVAAADIAHLHQVNNFFNEVLLYLPNVFVAVIVLIVATLLASFVSGLVQNLGQDNLGYITGLAKGAIYTFAILASLHQLNVAQPLIDILFTGIVATCVLAFGLGGRDIAHVILKKAYEDYKKKS